MSAGVVQPSGTYGGTRPHSLTPTGTAMAEIDDATALSALKDWSGAVATQWNYFSFVSLGAVGFAIHMREQHLDDTARLVAVSAFLLFAAGNHVALLRSVRIFVALGCAMRKRAVRGRVSPEEYAAVFKAPGLPSVQSVRWFHIANAVLVALVIWVASKAAETAPLCLFDAETQTHRVCHRVTADGQCAQFGATCVPAPPVPAVPNTAPPGRAAQGRRLPDSLPTTP